MTGFIAVRNTNDFSAINKYRKISDKYYAITVGVAASTGVSAIENHYCGDSDKLSDSSLVARLELGSNGLKTTVPIIAPVFTDSWMTYQTRNIIANTGPKTHGVGTLTRGTIYIQYKE